MRKLLSLILISSVGIAHAQRVIDFNVKKYHAATLSDSLRETSGLCFVNGKLFTFNDSGNTPDLFEIDKKSGKILKTIHTGLTNQDWESLATDGKNFFIGDFGNNYGNRKNLKIYQFNDVNSAEKSKEINFYYPEQKDFTQNKHHHDFDGEAMIFLNGKLHIFTKQWASKGTAHYTVNPENPELQAAQKVEEFPTGFCVTDAAYFDKKLYLVGYLKTSEVFLEIFDETEPGIFFTKKPLKYSLGSAISVGQIEGIAVDVDNIYLSGEKFKTPVGTVPQSFYIIPKEKLVR